MNAEDQCYHLALSGWISVTGSTKQCGSNPLTFKLPNSAPAYK
jgi:hypothetical protein